MNDLARCHSACTRGAHGEPTEVEVQLRDATPRFDVVGLPDAAGREARDRVRSALAASGYEFPRGLVVVNLAPAGTPKVGAAHDLPMAVGILAGQGVVPTGALRRALLFGELALDGRVRPVRGAFLLASTAAPRDLTEILAPPANAGEAALATTVPVHAVETLADAVLHLAGVRRLPVVTPPTTPRDRPSRGDFAEVRGQSAVKRALVVAAAGRHNVLLVGPPGCGKTLLAERFPDLLPPLTRAEALEVARLRSAAGLPVDGLPSRRPFRAPSCGASMAGVLGGGNPPGPGEVSLAHEGVLFLDETPQFRGDVLEGLRGPLEDGRITISRASCHVTLPARFQLLAAMNPCPCGHGAGPRCTCTPLARDRYRQRVSGPVLDRIDLRVALGAVRYEELRDRRPGQGTAAMRADVLRARDVQARRQGPDLLNAALGPDTLQRWCEPDAEGSAALSAACDAGKLTARGVGRILRVARTLADLAGEEGPTLASVHLRTALAWRL